MDDGSIYERGHAGIDRAGASGCRLTGDAKTTSMVDLRSRHPLGEEQGQPQPCVTTGPSVHVVPHATPSSGGAERERERACVGTFLACSVVSFLLSAIPSPDVVATAAPNAITANHVGDGRDSLRLTP